MSRSGCDRYAEARSAFVDGSIDPRVRDDLLTHLTGCTDCRAEIAELRRLRSLLSEPGTAATMTPATLQDRLVSIAAGQEQDPLWTRPFRRVEARPLPSRRRRRRRHAVVIATALGSLAFAGAGVGYVAAPTAAGPIPDPTASSRSEFAAAVADQPLGSDPVAAAMMVGAKLTASPASGSFGADKLASSVPDGTVTESDGIARAVALSGTALTAVEAAALLRRSVRAAGSYGVTGMEQIVVPDGAGSLQAAVSVKTVAGQGSDFTVSDETGAQLGQGFVPAADTAAGTDESSELLGLLAENYSLGGVQHVELLGRPVSVVEARRTGSTTTAAGAATPAARWWIDDRTGMLLGRQTYDATGALVQSSAYSSMEMTRGGFIDHPAPRLTVPVATATMAPATGSRLSVRGWDCQQRLAGLPLTEVRTDVGSDPTLVHLIYTDGVWTLSVFERRGTLTDVPSDARLDPALGAYVSGGLPRIASWQSGDVTFTVVTDATSGTLAEAVHSLPHASTRQPTTMKRIAAGWSRLISLTFG